MTRDLEMDLVAEGVENARPARPGWPGWACSPCRATCSRVGAAGGDPGATRAGLRLFRTGAPVPSRRRAASATSAA